MSPLLCKYCCSLNAAARCEQVINGQSFKWFCSIIPFLPLCWGEANTSYLCRHRWKHTRATFPSCQSLLYIVQQASVSCGCQGIYNVCGYCTYLIEPLHKDTGPYTLGLFESRVGAVWGQQHVRMFLVYYVSMWGTNCIARPVSRECRLCSPKHIKYGTHPLSCEMLYQRWNWRDQCC